MKIEKAKNEVIKSFKELDVGASFCPLNYSSLDIYIKTYDFVCEKAYKDSEDDVYNAIKLSNGMPLWFSEFDKVKIPVCKVVVE